MCHSNDITFCANPQCCKVTPASLARHIMAMVEFVLQDGRLYYRCSHGLADPHEFIIERVITLLCECGLPYLWRKTLPAEVRRHIKAQIEGKRNA